MLFSKDKWNNAREIMPYVQTSAALTFEKCQSAFADAEEIYLQKVLGAQLMARLQGIYDSNERSDDEQRLLTLAQRAEANLALYTQFDEFQLRLTDAGLQRQDSDTFKQAYRYQEKLVKQNYRNKGLNALDAIIEFLQVRETDFPEWKESELSICRRLSIVRTASEVNDVYYIENSNIIFLRLLPEIKNFEQLELVKVIGQELYNIFKMSLLNGWQYINNDESLMLVEQFRLECGRFIIAKAMASLFRTTGSLTDRGLYFDSQRNSSVDPNESVPANSTQSHEFASMMEQRAKRYEISLESSIELFMPQFFHGHESDATRRCNDEKKTYWA